jgi:hypothetical protein
MIQPDELREMLRLAGKALLNMSSEDQNIEEWAEKLAKDLCAMEEKEYRETIIARIQRAEDDIRAGRAISNEEMLKRLKEKFKK